jgi:hypothetical protein
VAVLVVLRAMPAVNLDAVEVVAVRREVQRPPRHLRVGQAVSLERMDRRP